MMKIHTAPKRIVIEIEEETFAEKGFTTERVIKEIKDRLDGSPNLEIEKVTLVLRDSINLAGLIKQEERHL
jgi:hypothetical protein